MDFLRVSDIQERLGLSASAAYRLAHELQHVQVPGGALLVYRASLDEWLAKHTKGPRSQAASCDPPSSPPKKARKRPAGKRRGKVELW